MFRIIRMIKFLFIYIIRFMAACDVFSFALRQSFNGEEAIGVAIVILILLLRILKNS